MNFKKSLIISLTITVGVITLLSAAIIILVNNSSQKANQIGQAESQIRAKNRALETLATLQSDSQKASAYLNQINEYFITKDRLINSRQELISLAQQNGIDLNVEFKDEVPPSNNEPRKINLILNFNSHSNDEFTNFINFLKTLENSKYFIKFTNAELNKEGGRLTGTLSGQIFSF